jgi:hypothetical protein
MKGKHARWTMGALLLCFLASPGFADVKHVKLGVKGAT